MKKNKSYRLNLIKVCLVVLGGLALNLSTSVSVYADNLIKNTPSVVVGKLENGLTYYIQKTEEPSKKIKYSLILKAGAMDEDDSQRGYAHFNEHLSFDGTPTFNCNIVEGKFLKGVDLKDVYLNAYTSKTETVYSIALPDARTSLQDTAIILMSEWLMSDFANMESIDKQRSIIAKEWLELQDAGERMRLQWHPVLFNDSKWGHRRSIGEIDLINNGAAEDIIRFRNEWYRPDLAAVCVIGNVDEKEVEAKIKKYFSIKNPNKVNRKKEIAQIPDSEKRNVVVASDKDHQFSYMSMYNRHISPNLSTKEGIKRSLMYSMLNGIASERYQDCLEKNNGVITIMGATISSMMEPNNLYSPMVSFTKGNAAKAVELMATEQERIAQHGFLDIEFENIKKLFTDKYEAGLNNVHPRSQQQWEEMMKQNFLKEAPMLSTKEEAAIYLPILKTITKEDMEALHAELWAEKNSTLVIQIPESDVTSSPTADEASAIMDEVKTRKLAPYKRIVFDKPLFSLGELPQAGTVARKEQVIEEMPIMKWTLSNGAEIVYYQDSTKTGTIYLEAISKGGKNALKERDRQLANIMCEVVNEGPIGNYNSSRYHRFMGAEKMDMEISMTDDTEVIKGSASVRSFDKLLQRVYHLFNVMELSGDTYEGVFNRRMEYFNASSSGSAGFYQNFMFDKRSKDHFDSNADVSDVSLKEMQQILDDRFDSVSDFTFYFSGAIHQVDFEKEISKYLAVGEKTKRERYTKSHVKELKGDHQFKVKKGADPRANVTYVIGAPVTTDMNTMTELQMISSILDGLLFTHVREKHHLVYSIKTKLQFQVTQNPRADFEISYQCDPKDIDKIEKEIRHVFKTFIAEGPDPMRVKQLSTMMVNSKKMYASNDHFRIGCMRSHDQYYKNDYRQQLDNINFIENINAQSLQDILSKIYNNKKGLKSSFILLAE